MRDFYNVLFRNKRKILVFFFSVMIVVTLGTLLASEVYQSEAELMVRLGRESVTLDPTATMGQVVNIGSERENEINSETVILKSRELAEKVVDALGVELILEGPEETLAPGDSLYRIIRHWMRLAVRQTARDEPALTGAGYQGLRTLAQVGVAAFNILINLWIIPAYGWRGAAWSSIASDGLLALSFWLS